MAVDFTKDEPPFGPIVDGNQIIFYHYLPNDKVAWAFLVFFAITAVAHIFFFFKLRAWHFLPLILGLIGEVFGYYGRGMAHREPNVAGPFIMQNLLILGMAPMIAATVYMSLGRLIKALDLRQHMAISPKFTTAFYIIVDIGCFGTQVIGSVIPASGDAEGIKLGRNLIIGGLIAQLVALSLFIFSSFHAQVWARRTSARRLGASKSIRSTKYFVANYVAAGAMILRALVRGIEYLQGADGIIISNEVFLYVFDAALMVLIAVLYLFIHPGRLVRDAQRMRTSNEPMELKY